MAATSLPQGGMVSQVFSYFLEWPSHFISFIPVQLSLHFCGSILLHPPLCILDSLQDPSLRSLGLAFIRHGGFYSSIYLSSKMLPYGRIVLSLQYC